MMTEQAGDGSFDPQWPRAIQSADLAELRTRLNDLVMWAYARLDRADHALAGRDLANPTPADLIHLTERTALVTVLTTLAGDEDDE
jgi:hypothetical protein